MAVTSYIVPNDIAALFPDITSNDQLQDICNEITTLIDEYCNTSFVEKTISGEKLDSKQEVVPTMGPITSVTSLKDDGDTLTENTDFYAYRDYIYIVDPSLKRKGILATYKYGYTVTPQIVKWVAKELAQYKAERADTEILFKSQKGEDFAYTMDEDGMAGILSVLDDGYKRPKPDDISGSGDSLRRNAVLRVGVI
jgi:hypothetical protein